MLEPETKRTLITCCTTVFGTISAVIITQLFTYLNNKSDKSKSIYQKQYEEIFSPIHRVLFFAPSDNVIENLRIIRNIIYKNYGFASDALIEEFIKCDDNNKITDDFIQIIKSGYILLRNKLGYSKLKLKRVDKKKASKSVIITSNRKNSKYVILEFSFYFCMFILCFVLSFTLSLKSK